MECNVIYSLLFSLQYVDIISAGSTCWNRKQRPTLKAMALSKQMGKIIQKYLGSQMQTADVNSLKDIRFFISDHK